MMARAMNLKRATAILLLCAVPVSQGVLASQQTPDELARAWVEAIKANSTEKMRALIHPACPQGSVSPEILARMVQGGLPEKYEIETRPLDPQAELGKVYQVVPHSQLTLKFLTKTREEKARYGLGKGFPIAPASGEWFFVVCLKSS